MADNLDLGNDQDNLDQQTEAPDWRSSLSPNLREHPTISKFKNANELATSWIEAQKLVGRDKIPVPGEKATKEDWDIVFDRLGRPKVIDGYQLPEVKLPNGFPAPDEQYIKAFKEKALELGLLPSQVNNLYGWFMENEGAKYAQMMTQREDSVYNSEKALRQEWGKAFDQNYQLAENAVLKFGTDEFVNKLKMSGLNNDPDMIKFIASMAKNMSEDGIAGSAPSYTMSPNEAIAEIAKLKGEALKDRAHPLNNKHHPEYQLIKEKWDSLHKMAYPDNVA